MASSLGAYEPASQVWTDPVTGAVVGTVTRQGTAEATSQLYVFDGAWKAVTVS